MKFKPETLSRLALARKIETQQRTIDLLARLEAKAIESGPCSIYQEMLDELKQKQKQGENHA